MVPKLRFAYPTGYYGSVRLNVSFRRLPCNAAFQHADISSTACTFLSVLLADSPHQRSLQWSCQSTTLCGCCA